MTTGIMLSIYEMATFSKLYHDQKVGMQKQTFAPPPLVVGVWLVHCSGACGSKCLSAFQCPVTTPTSQPLSAISQCDHYCRNPMVQAERHFLRVSESPAE